MATSTLIRGKIIGQTDGHTFRKNIKGSQHLLRKPRAIAIDAPAFEKEISPSHQRIEVLDTEKNTLYATTVDYFDLHKGEMDRGYGRQYYLTLNHWQVTDLNPNAPRQLSFAFEGRMNA